MPFTNRSQRPLFILMSAFILICVVFSLLAQNRSLFASLKEEVSSLHENLHKVKNSATKKGDSFVRISGQPPQKRDGKKGKIDDDQPHQYEGREKDEDSRGGMGKEQVSQVKHSRSDDEVYFFAQEWISAAVKILETKNSVLTLETRFSELCHHHQHGKTVAEAIHPWRKALWTALLHQQHQHFSFGDQLNKEKNAFLSLSFHKLPVPKILLVDLNYYPIEDYSFQRKFGEDLQNFLEEKFGKVAKIEVFSLMKFLLSGNAKAQEKGRGDSEAIFQFVKKLFDIDVIICLPLMESTAISNDASEQTKAKEWNKFSSSTSTYFLMMLAMKSNAVLLDLFCIGRFEGEISEVKRMQMARHLQVQYSAMETTHSVTQLRQFTLVGADQWVFAQERPSTLLYAKDPKRIPSIDVLLGGTAREVENFLAIREREQQKDAAAKSLKDTDDREFVQDFLDILDFGPSTISGKFVSKKEDSSTVVFTVVEFYYAVKNALSQVWLTRSRMNSLHEFDVRR